VAAAAKSITGADGLSPGGAVTAGNDVVLVVIGVVGDNP
jgi:hypothetical protein